MPAPDSARRSNIDVAIGRPVPAPQKKTRGETAMNAIGWSTVAALGALISSAMIWGIVEIWRAILGG